MKILYAISALLLTSTDSVLAAQAKDDNNWQLVTTKRTRRQIRTSFTTAITIGPIQRIILGYWLCDPIPQSQITVEHQLYLAELRRIFKSDMPKMID